MEPVKLNKKSAKKGGNSTKQSNRSHWLYKHLDGLLQKIPADAKLFGPLTRGKFCMPKSSQDLRELTWETFLSRLVSEIQNNPADINCCWLVKTDNEGQHQKKLDKKGSGNKFATYRMLKVIQDWSDRLHSIVEQKQPEEAEAVHFAHRCGRGKTSEKGGQICINPYHIEPVSAKVNQDHKGCKYGCAYLCPHSPKCIWTWKNTGEPKPCFNNLKYLSNKCEHKPKCIHEIDPDPSPEAKIKIRGGKSKKSSKPSSPSSAKRKRQLDTEELEEPSEKETRPESKRKQQNSKKGKKEEILLGEEDLLGTMPESDGDFPQKNKA